MIENPALILLVITATIALSYIMETKFKWARRMGSVLTIITFGIIFSNIGLVPQTAPLYDVTFEYILPLSISLLLLRLGIKDLKQLDKKLLLYWLLAVSGSIIGVLVTFFVFKSFIGDEAWKLSGQLTASFIGGGENAVAVGTALDVSKNLFTASFAADNVVTAIWMLVCLSAPLGLGKFFSSKIDENVIEQAKEQSKPFTSHEILPSIAYSLTTAGVIIFVSEVFVRYIPQIPAIIWVTTFSIIVGQTPLREKLKLSYLLGTLLFSYFFFVMGAISSVQEILRLGPLVFVYVAMVVVIHGAVVFGVGKMIKADLPKLLLASQATIGGPSTACALAEANGWPHLVIPGILVGILGYATANYLGFAIAYILQVFFG